MQTKLQSHSWMKIAVPHILLGKGMAWGMVGGLVATVIMDLVLICAFLVAGMPWFSCFSIVGDTVAHLLPYQNVANSVLLGAAAHYLIGPVLGTIFGITAPSVNRLQAGSWKRAILFAVLYVEIASQPILALTPIFLQMTASETLIWFGGSFGMHFIWGCVLGVIWRLGWRRPLAINPG